MSTKIYNGFKFTPSKPHEIHKIVTGQFRKHMEAIALYRLERRLVRLAVGAIDEAAIAGATVDSALRDARRKLEEEEKEQIKEGQIPSFGCEIAMFPISRNKTLGYYFCRDDKMEAFLKRQDWFIDYHYQNQTDEPSDVTPAQWGRRKRDWDIALPGIGILSESSWLIKVVNRPTMLLYGSIWKSRKKHYERLMRRLPSFENRVRHQTEDFACSEYFKTLDPKPKDMNDSMGAYWKFRDFVRKTEEGKEFWKKQEAVVAEKLKKDLTLQDLLGKDE